MFDVKRKLLLSVVFGTLLTNSASAAGGRLFREELDLPTRGLSQRVTQRFELKPGEAKPLFDESGPGCILHWWMTCSHGKRAGQEYEMPHELTLRFYYDNEPQPAIELTVAQFFSVLLGRDVYPVNNAAIKVLPKNAFNCYLPIPFQHLRMELHNSSQFQTTVWFMADWHEYPAEQSLTPLRLHAIHRREAPAAPFGSFLMADLTGEGFLAGMVQAVAVRDRTDAWYHSGGDTVLLDGETRPRAIRGIGGEDVFNMSFGIWPVQTDWVGAPYLSKTGEDTKLGSGHEGVMYRIFGPAPIWFESSAIVRFGSKANDLESLIYAYVAPRAVAQPITVPSWQLAGPFSCDDYQQFQKAGWAEEPVSQWPQKHVADFKPYIANLNHMPQGPTEFAVPITATTQHGWCDLAEHYRGRQRTNNGAQPANVCAYAVGEVDVPAAGKYLLHVGFDDWITIWIDNQRLPSKRHDHGFAVETIPVTLPAGKVQVRVKLSNQDNFQWRLWAFNLRLTPTEQN